MYQYVAENGSFAIYKELENGNIILIGYLATPLEDEEEEENFENSS